MQEVANIKSWIDVHASPFAWQRILFKLLPEFKKEGFFFHTIKDDSKLSLSLLRKISEALSETYKIELSSEFFQTNNKDIIVVNEDEQQQSSIEETEDVFQNNISDIDTKNTDDSI